MPDPSIEPFTEQERAEMMEVVAANDDLLIVLKALLDHAEAPAGSGWLPIITAPQDGTKIDIWAKTWLPGSDTFIGHRFTDCWWSNGDSMVGRHAHWMNLEPHYFATYWMPLPDPPTVTR